VEKHLHAIFRKLGVVSRVEAAILAVQESLVKKDLNMAGDRYTRD
jgi:DNA-binding NarL/FixJ family response regulator